MAQLVRQFAMLPAMWLTGKIDFTKEQNKNNLLIVFGLVLFVGYSLIQFAVRKVRSVNDSARVKEPGTSMHIKDEDKAQDGSVSVRQYDHAKLQESKMQFIMSAAISAFVHIKWDYTQPIVIMCIMLPLQIWDNKAVKLHMFGLDVGPRPWASDAQNNPLAQWAEKKKAEADVATKKDTKKNK